MKPEHRQIAIEFDPSLVEEVVLLAMASRPGASYWPDREACYRIADEEQRERAFLELARKHFAALGLAAPLETALDEQPLVAQAVGACRVLRAVRKGSSGAELFLPREAGAIPGERRVVLRVAPCNFLDPAALLHFLRHELEHVADMLDPRFGYQPTLPEVDGGPTRLKVILDRYRVLWGTSIEGRLCRRGQAPDSSRETWRRQFAGTFGMLGERSEAAFRRFFDGERPVHEEMLRFACEPGIEMGGGQGTSPEVCPLCRGLAHPGSAARRSLVESVAAEVQGDFPSWKPADGLCLQCADLYRARQGARTVAACASALTAR